MNPFHEFDLLSTRRQLFGRTALGVSTAALASLLSRDPAFAAPAGGAQREDGDFGRGVLSGTHFPAKAKRLIYIVANGGPSQMDLFDYKPNLGELFDTDLPDSIRMGQRLTTMTSGQARFPIAPSKFKFAQHGQSGAWISELLPKLTEVADDLCLVRSVNTSAINHDPAITFIQSGAERPGRPSLGAWLSYGLGSANDSLPTYVVLHSTWSGRKEAQAIYERLWSAGFLSSQHAGVSLRATGDPVLFLSNPPGVSSASRRHMLDALGALNQQQFEQYGDPEIATRIAQYEMAYRMQFSVPELTDFSTETQATLDLYGPEVSTPGTVAANCLLARRLVERNVRYVQIFHRGWDQHGNLPKDLPNQARDIDHGLTGLIQDLKQRGLLDDTLVIWGGGSGEPYCQGGLTRENYGRDHHPKCYTMLLAGGGVKPGITYGTTDDFSYNIVEHPVHIHDLNATLLHCLGIDHTKLTYRFQGRDFRLTDVHGDVVHDILA